MKSKKFNEGFWLAVQEFCGNGCGNDMAYIVIANAGFTRLEFKRMINTSNFKWEQLLPIINEILKRDGKRRLVYHEDIEQVK